MTTVWHNAWLATVCSQAADYNIRHWVKRAGSDFETVATDEQQRHGQRDTESWERQAKVERQKVWRGTDRKPWVFFCVPKNSRSEYQLPQIYDTTNDEF